MSSIATYILKYNDTFYDYRTHSDSGELLCLCTPYLLQLLDGQFLEIPVRNRTVKPNEENLKLTIYTEQRENTTKVYLLRENYRWNVVIDHHCVCEYTNGHCFEKIVGFTYWVEEELDRILGNTDGFYTVFVEVTKIK